MTDPQYFRIFNNYHLQELEERQRSLHEAEIKRQQVEKDLENRENIALQRQKIPLNSGEKTGNLYEPDGNGLKRRSFSHSSPNIAKMMEDEDDTSPGMTSVMNYLGYCNLLNNTELTDINMMANRFNFLNKKNRLG